MKGSDLVCKCLKSLETNFVYGVLGIPIMEMGDLLHANGIRFIAFRNEQSASYAANAHSFFNPEHPGVVLTVAGPGLVHALGGMANAKSNSFPMVVISASFDQDQGHRGAFQEMDQLTAVSSFANFKARVELLETLPRLFEAAFRTCVYTRTISYLEIPGNLFDQEYFGEWFCSAIKPLPLLYPDPHSVQLAVVALMKSSKPLMVIGKGAVISKSDKVVREFVNLMKIPFVSMPMAKGLIPDTNELCFSAARSLALSEADVIILVGAQLNWMLHFGDYPKFRKNVLFVQLENQAARINTHNNCLPLFGDINSGLKSLLIALQNEFKVSQEWILQLSEAKSKNLKKLNDFIAEPCIPWMNYHHVFHTLSPLFQDDCIVISEGANTMDISRTMILHSNPRSRLDAGSFGTISF